MDYPNISKSISVVHPISIERGKNAEVWDVSGKRYIDFIGGIGVLNLGHCHPKIVEAATQQLTTLMHSAFNAVPHKKYLDLSVALARFIPLDYEKSIMLTNSGTEATENALKMARAFTGRGSVIAFDDAFHGRTLAALNLNGKVKPYKNKIGQLPGSVYHVPYPSIDTGITCEQTVNALKRLIEVEVDIENIAAIFFEPVQGEGGFNKLDNHFAIWLRMFCDKHGVILIADEIQSGFGRTGQKFAFQHLNIEPDLILVGKSVANGLPLAGVCGRREIMDTLPAGGLGGTYSGNAVACAASLAVIDIMTDENLAAWGSLLEEEITSAHARWRSLDLPMIGSLTGVGSMRGVIFQDTISQTGTQHLADLLTLSREAGVLLMPSGRKRNVLRLLPPLTTSRTLLREGLAIIEKVLTQLHP